MIEMSVAVSIVLLPSLGASPGRRLRAATWVCAIHPVLILASFYATWLTAWCVLGHPPRVYADDPKYIGPIVGVPYGATHLLIQGLPLIWLLGAALIVVEFIRHLFQPAIQPLKEAVQRVAAPLLWEFFLLVSSFAVLRWDPLRVVYWYMD
jgi:Na+/proline symporter